MMIIPDGVTREQIIEVLEKARDRITPEGAWTQYTMARDRNEWHVSPHSPMAARWCAFGAVVVESVHVDKLGFYATEFLSKTTGLDEKEHSNPLAVFNDDYVTTQSDVIALFNKTIDTLKAEL